MVLKMLVSESNIFKPDVMMVNIVEMDGATWVTEVQRTTTVEKMELLALTHVTSHHNIDRWNRKRKLFRPRACASIKPATQSDVASDRWTNWKMWCVYSFLSFRLQLFGCDVAFFRFVSFLQIDPRTNWPRFDRQRCQPRSRRRFWWWWIDYGSRASPDVNYASSKSVKKKKDWESGQEDK